MTDLQKITEMFDKANERYELGPSDSLNNSGTIMEVDVGTLGFYLYFNPEGNFITADAPVWEY